MTTNLKRPKASIRLPSITAFVALAIALTPITGCVNVGTTKFPTPTAEFTPKRTYSHPLAQAYEKVERTLDDARIPIATQNKSDTSARFQTDYISGESQLIGGGFIASQSTRYRYQISLRPKEDTTTAINVVCTIESTMSGRSGASPWTDVSGQNAQRVAQLENWLYEQIEKNL